MLEILKIKNIAIVDSAEVRFKNGLNILSGETGAGKSIIIESISLLLGSRANTDLIRTGHDEAVVEGLFDIADRPEIQERIERLGFKSPPTELLIKRTVHRSGKHRIYVNGELATLSILQELCEGLVDLCGQHEHQSLVRPRVQLELLDRYGGLQRQAEAVDESYRLYHSLEKELRELQNAEAERARKIDFLSFQIEELRDASLTPGEDEKLQAEKKLLQSAETRAQSAEDAREILEADESGVLNALRSALSKLRSLHPLDDRAKPLFDNLERSFAEAEECAIGLNRYIASSDINPDRLQEVQDRLSLLAELRRKYGETVNEMLDTLSRLETEHASLQQIEKKVTDKAAEIEGAKSELLSRGKKLSQARKKAAALFSSSVTAELKDLKMGDAKFMVSLESSNDLSQWTCAGADTIQFVVETNAGESAKPLGKIASGGELSRLMLSIRRVISDKGGIGVYLFDEIDAGIGGQTAFQVGKKLRSVAAHNQVLCITHLPQVASFADQHWVVRKKTAAQRTITEVKELSRDERKEELARMLGGPALTRKSIENAAELIEMARG